MTAITEKRMEEKVAYIGCTCDGCGKITDNSWPAEWVRVEAAKSYDACSARCMVYLINRLINENDRRSSTLQVNLSYMDEKFARGLVDLVNATAKSSPADSDGAA